MIDYATTPVDGRAGLARRAAVVAAVAVAVAGPWLLVRSGGFGIAVAVNGLAVGFGMRWALRASRVRRLGVALATVAGVAVVTVTGLYAADYLAGAVELNRITFGHRFPPGRPWTASTDQVLRQRTGHGGPGGYLLDQWHRFAVVMVGVVGVTAWLGWSVARRALTDPTCPACDAPLPPPRTAAVVGIGAVVPLVAAVEADDAGRVRAAVAAAGEDRSVVARSYRCPACGRRSVDAVASMAGSGTTITLMAVTVVSDAVDAALRGEPAPPVVGPRLVVD